jgi:signal transduction histidine kinase
MTLARQQWLFVSVALALLIAVAAMLVANQLRVGRALEGLSQGQSVVRTVLMMRIVAGEVSIDPTERHAIQWRAGMRDLMRALDAMRKNSAHEEFLLQSITQNIMDADELFRRLGAAVAHQGTSRVSQPSGIVSARVNDALQLALGSVNLAALRLSELQADEVRAARGVVLRTSFFLVLAMLAILVTYMLVFRRLVLAPIRRLQGATDRIARGDLEHRVALGSKDELGELGRRFDHMAGELQVSQNRMVAANKELEAFAYSVSHDLRAPLRGMDAFSRILMEKYASNMEEDARHCLQMIRGNAQQMGRLIDDLLSFSRLGQQPLRKERVDQNALVRAVIESLQAERQGRRIDLTVEDLPAAEADPRLLKQVWVNLISNAFKYTRGRDPAAIRIGSQAREGGPAYYVQDNGVGFDMRYAHKLFKVFQRLHRAEDYEGTGVGLAIVQRIIGRHGGRVWPQAAKNQGATFYFTLEGTGEHAQQ